MIVWCIASIRRKQEVPLVVFTGGGTGGHVYPAIAVAQKLAERHPVRLLWIGSRNSIETGIVSAAGIPLVGIPSGKLRRYFSLRNVTDVFAVALGVVVSIFVLLVRRPKLVFSKGGYVSVPPVLAAAFWRVPIVTHESDLDPGLATRINARFADRILVPYEESLAAYPLSVRDRVEVTGTPIRPDILTGDSASGLREAGFDGADPRPILLVLGGSQGSVEVNEIVHSSLPRIGASWRVIHQTGPHDQAQDSDASYFARPFFSGELPDLLACADVVLCRAGATTLWEVAALEKPMILVPLRGGSRGDQERNAGLFQANGAAIVLEPGDLTPADLERWLERLRDDQSARSVLGRNARKLIHIDSADRIVAILGEMLGG